MVNGQWSMVGRRAWAAIVRVLVFVLSSGVFVRQWPPPNEERGVMGRGAIGR